MSYINHSRNESAPQKGRYLWLLLLFLAAVFFLCQQDLFYSSKRTESFDLSPDETIAALDASSPSRRVAVLALGFFAVTSLICQRAARLRINGLLGWIMVFYAGWALLSVVWAEDASQTFKRLVVFAILCLAAAAVARRVSLRKIVLGVLFTTGLYLLIGLSAEIALGAFRPFTPGYRFAGTLHPNFQGINCALLLLSGVAAADMEKRRQILLGICALLGFVFLILTTSRTSIAAALLALAVYFGARCSKRTKIVATLGLGTALLVPLVIDGGALIPNLKSAIALSRDNSAVDSFHGRAGVWREVGYYVYKRPILGYGYGGFWNEPHITEISATEQWGVSSSHSVYLECLLNVGLVGLAAYIFSLIGGITRSLALYRASQAPAFAFSGAFLIFCAANGVLESAILWSESVTFLMMVVLIKLGLQSREFEVKRLLNYG